MTEQLEINLPAFKRGYHLIPCFVLLPSYYTFPIIKIAGRF